MEEGGNLPSRCGTKTLWHALTVAGATAEGGCATKNQMSRAGTGVVTWTPTDLILQQEELGSGADSHGKAAFPFSSDSVVWEHD